MKFLRPILVFLIVTLSLPAFAQPMYIAGYVVKSNGDTLKGYVKYLDYDRWSQCPKSIKFKADSNDHKVLKFNPHTIREFHVNGHETYITYAGWISSDSNVFPALPFALDTSKKLDTIFLKQVVKGKHLALYYHNDWSKTRYFIAENNGPQIELKYHLYFESEKKLVARRMYSQMLIDWINKYAPSNEKLMELITDMHFTQADFEDFVTEINNSD